MCLQGFYKYFNSTDNGGNLETLNNILILYYVTRGEAVSKGLQFTGFTVKA